MTDNIQNGEGAACICNDTLQGRGEVEAPEAWGDRECSGCTLPRRDCECN